jgi:nucleoside phosphorylase
MSRFNDVTTRSLAFSESTELPAVDWTLVGQSAPTLVSIDYPGPTGKLPDADAIVITWTSAEWAAMNHVFLRSGQAESPAAAEPAAGSWYLYTRGAPSGDSQTNPLWGYYQLVSIPGLDGTQRRILLFKSDAHLAYSPYLSGLTQEVQNLIADVAPRRIYSIGTAGGATDQQNLGDVAITNCGTCQLKLAENSDSPDNGKTFSSADFFPNTANLLPAVQEKLFVKLASVATMAEWQCLLAEAQRETSGKSLAPYTLDDLINSPIDPANLNAPKAVSYRGIPLLTTDYYYIAQQNSPQYAVLEMDDAVIGAAASQLNVPFAFIRNISDAFVVTTDKSGNPIPDPAREAWSSVQYDHFGIYTAVNGALATWATLVDW